MNPTRTNLESAANGLLFLSESEAPLYYFEAPADAELTDDLIVRLSGHTTGTPVSRTDVNSFFRNMLRDYPEASESDKAITERFRKLVQVINDELSETVVFRIGHRQIDAFIAGKTKEGMIAGLQTKLIET